MPLYDEPGALKTVESLRESAESSREPLCVVCVVNNRASSPQRVKDANRALFCSLRSLAAGSAASASPMLELRLIDAFSRGREIPERHGVGLARKIGMDYVAAAQAADFTGKVIACMDGDTLVDKNYAAALGDFARSGRAAGVLAFVHQNAENAAAEKAVRAYEAFLRGHAAALKACGVPYWRTALGPAIACSLEAYCRSGGMNTRLAGEDFYFLQSLTKFCLSRGETVADIPALVHPESRLSCRTPFGTGQKIAELCAAAAVPAYPQAVYDEIAFFIARAREAAWLQNASPSRNAGQEPDGFARELASHPALHDFLQTEGFFTVWEKLKQNYLPKDGGAPAAAQRNRLVRGFHTWFDGLKVIRLIHRLTQHAQI
jgi:hypothetical protein